LPVQGAGTHDEVPCIGIGSTVLLNPMPYIPKQFGAERPREPTSDLALGLHQIVTIRIEVVGPDMRTRFRVDQLHVDLNPVDKPSHAAFEHIADPEVAANLLHVNWFALVGEGGGASDHEAVGDLREVGRQIVGDRVRKIFLLRIVRQICERQNDD
jgi:hypothetical protein